MLSFNPKTRLSAQDLLLNPIFDSVRIKKIEKGAPFKLDIDIDAMADGQISQLSDKE